MIKHRSILIFILYLIIGILLYLPTLTAPWQFDDLEHVLRRNQVGQDRLFDLLTATFKIASEPKGTRALVNASFLLNWRLSREPIGFHLVNIAIHAAASLVVFLLIREILRHYKWHKKDTALWALVGSLIFLVHPIQSQAVAYITQRFESLSSFFYLLTLYQFIKKRYILAWLIGFLAASSKETAITLPIAIIAIDLLLGNFSRKALMKRLILYAFFLLLSLKILLQLFSDTRSLGLMQGGNLLQKISSNTQVIERNRSLTRFSYLLTQTSVIPIYLRLIVFPVGQSIDHDFPIVQSFWQWPTPLFAFFLLALLALMVKLAGRQPLLSFAVFFFFLTLSISSSIFPIDDVSNEHRLYLPMFGFVLFVIWLVGVLTRRVIYTLIAILFLLSILTFRRSLVWSTPLNLWEDAWKKAPDKPRTNKNYGFLLTEAGRIPEGIEKLQKAVELYDVSDYRRNLGLAYLKAGDYPHAEAEFRLAFKRDPSDSKPPSDLGVALAQQGKYAEAVASFQEALKLDPSLYEALIGVGGVSILTGDYQAAQVYLNRAREREPLDPRSYNNLYVLYVRQKDAIKAREILDLLSQIDSNYPGLKERYEELRKIQNTK